MRLQQLSSSGLLLFQAFFIFAPMAVLGGAIDWPASLDFPADQTLPLMRAEQASVRLGYGLYLAWSLAFAGSAAVIVRLANGARPVGALAMLAIGLGVASALARAIGIVRWLSGSAALADAYAAAPEGSVERVAIETAQTALNAYGGTIGEDLGVGMFAAMWLVCVGVIILRDRGLPPWLGWLAFPVAAVSSTPSLALVGITSPVDVVVATTSMLLWIAAVAIALLARAVRSPRARLETVSA
jgi:Domain of unknown function (DUF4386)